MPKTHVVIFKDEKEENPLLKWMDKLPQEARVKATDKIGLLEEFGFALRRPHCDYLEEGIHELRFRYRNVHYRILYFFHKKNTAVLSHGCSKRKRVPKREIEKAIRNMFLFSDKPNRHR